MQAASDGDRDLTIWTWLRPVARPALPLSLAWRLALAGCQVVPGDGPWMGGAQASSTEALPFDVIDLTPTSVVAYRPAASVDSPSATSSLSAGGRVRRGSGDVLKVRIFEPYEGSIFPTIQRPGRGSRHPAGDRRGHDQRALCGHRWPSPASTSARSSSASPSQLKGKAQDPQVIVEFVADRSHTVMVSGDVKNPGRVSILEGRAVGRRRHQSRRRTVSTLPGGPGRGRGAAQRPGHPDGAVFRPACRRRYRRSRRTTRSSCGPIRATFTVLGAVTEIGQCRAHQAQLTLLEALG